MVDTIPIISLSAQILSALTSLALIKKYKFTFFYLLVSILCLSATVEVLGVYFKEIKQPSQLLYSVYTFLIFNLIFFLYNQIIVKKTKYILVIPIICFNILFIFLYIYKLSYFKALIFGFIITSFYILLYLRQLLLSDEIINYKRLLPFWVSVGFLVCYLPSVPFFTFIDYMQNRGLFFIIYILVTLMHFFIIYGLLCSSKEEKY